MNERSTAKTAGLAVLAAQFTIGAIQQGRGVHEVASDALKGQYISNKGILSP